MEIKFKRRKQLVKSTDQSKVSFKFFFVSYKQDEQDWQIRIEQQILEENGLGLDFQIQNF